ncbi:M4 family metallopeptidase [Streptomyces physcomitrii]|uniref:Neutral metalloproteinase n=1 Tax=Streptomyces physcomitrii TaxID=2724184 RepID=A0ABX1HC61_9ACTN|nr:M4 family metallopeptidase [Streptomyces physcomitrii]NKI44824.1 M4 family metallopeptidase [Streptomyces physcomitrii]
MSSLPRIPGRRNRRLALAGGAATVAAALLAVGAASTAGAAPEQNTDTSLTGTARSLGLGAKEKLVVKDVVKDKDGTVHTRYERTYAGLPVLGGDLVVHRAKGGKVEGVTKAAEASIKLASLSPKLAPHTARSAALKAAAAAEAKKPTTEQAPRKVVWAASGKPVLAYETVVGGVQEDGTPSRLHVITDAGTGKKLYEFQDIKNGSGTSQYSGKVEVGSTKSDQGFELVDGERGGHETRDLDNAESGEGTILTDEDDDWGDGTPENKQTAGVDAAYGFAQTSDFYKDVLGRDGIRDDGKAPTSHVHFGTDYVNAFWDPQTFSIYYGDGEGGKKPLNQLDVAGHEFSHGVTEATAGLEYSGESGGLNEATSDIFGTAIEFHADNAEDPGDYLLGEKIDINGDGTPLRYQDKPSKDGASADYWDENTGDLDVHYSSGVANHFFYLLSEGSGAKEINGVEYDSPTADGSTVEGIGRDKAVQIWYKALTSYFTSTTDYAGAREGTLKAAADLYGEGSPETEAVAAAWTGVNVKG